MSSLGSLTYYVLLTIGALWVTCQFCYILASLTRTNLLSYYPRVLASFVAIFLCAVYGTISSALLNLIGYGGLGQWTTARAFKWMMLMWTGVWMEVEDTGVGKTWGGKQLGEGGYLSGIRPMVMVGNHQSELDVLVLGHVFPRYSSVTAKASLRLVPVLGWFSMASYQQHITVGMAC
jgi:lysophosphatidate acyltransferase